MTRMLDLIEDYLFLSGHPFERLDGSVAGERRQQVRATSSECGSACARGECTPSDSLGR